MPLFALFLLLFSTEITFNTALKFLLTAVSSSKSWHIIRISALLSAQPGNELLTITHCWEDYVWHASEVLIISRSHGNLWKGVLINLPPPILHLSVNRTHIDGLLELH